MYYTFSRILWSKGNKDTYKEAIKNILWRWGFNMEELFLSEGFSIFMFFVPPIISLITLYFLKRKLIWLSIPITILFDLLFWGKAILDSSYGRGLTAIFLIPQISVVIIISLAIIYREKRGKWEISLVAYLSIILWIMI